MGLRLIELLAMLIVVQEKIVHSLMFCMDMLFLSCMSFFVYAFDLKHKNGGFIVSYFVGVPQSHYPVHIYAGDTTVCPDHSMFACFVK